MDPLQTARRHQKRTAPKPAILHHARASSADPCDRLLGDGFPIGITILECVVPNTDQDTRTAPTDHDGDEEVEPTEEYGLTATTSCSDPQRLAGRPDAA